MLVYTVRKSVIALVLLVLVSIATTGFLYLLPPSADPGGPPVADPAEATPVSDAAPPVGLPREGGFHRRYFQLMQGLAGGRLASTVNGESVRRIVARRLPATLALVGVALVLIFSFGISIGVLRGRFAGRWVDHVLSGPTMVLLAMPGFWVASLLVRVLVEELGIPVTGPAASGGFLQRAWFVLVPGFVLALPGIAILSGFVRARMSEALRRNYIRVAAARGIPKGALHYRHVLKNAMRPVATSIGYLVPTLLGGAVVVENVFGYPGIGGGLVHACRDADFPTVIGVLFAAAIIVIVGKFLSDVLLGFVEPRVRPTGKLPVPPLERSSPWHRAIEKFTHNPSGMAGMVLVAATLAAAIAFFLCAQFDVYPAGDPALPSGAGAFAPPGDGAVLGTDGQGRSVSARLLDAAGPTLGIALMAIAVSLMVGSTIGILSGYAGGRGDRILMRLVDALASFPGFFLVVTLAALAGPGVEAIIIAIGLVHSIRIAGLIRDNFVAIRRSGFVRAARVVGHGRLGTALRHVIPRVFVPLTAAAVAGIPYAILAESTASFLGLGAGGSVLTWGGMAGEARPYFLDAWWLLVFPGLAISVATLSFHVTGEALRDSLRGRARFRYLHSR